MGQVLAIVLENELRDKQDALDKAISIAYREKIPSDAYFCFRERQMAKHNGVTKACLASNSAPVTLISQSKKCLIQKRVIFVRLQQAFQKIRLTEMFNKKKVSLFVAIPRSGRKGSQKY